MRAVRFSVVIPTLNEADFLPRCLASLHRALPDSEVIVVDGGSRDETCALAKEAGARVLHTTPSRGGQCRLGAAAATHEVLFFLHADTTLTEGAEAALQRFFQSPNHQVATLRVLYPPTRWLHRLVAFGSRFDTLLSSTGDQGILVRRAVYDAVGGMPDQPLFEDVEFFRRVRRHARVHSIDVGLHVSMRRFERRGFMRQLLFNTYLSGLYVMGVPPQELAQRYRSTEKR